MQINYRNFPHPVLSFFSDDYKNCLFQANVAPTVTKTKYRFSVVSKTSSRDLRGFVDSGQALHALHVECPATRFRKLYTSADEKFDVEIDADNLDAHVYLLPLVVASTDISNYSSDDFHSDFSGTSFNIKKGDLLAIDRDRSFIAQKDVDPLRRIPSIFTIVRNAEANPPVMDVDSSGHKVVVKLGPSTFEAYSLLAKNAQMAPVLSSLVIVPALTELVALVSPGGEDTQTEHGAKRWYQVLQSKLAGIGYAAGEEIDDSPACVAQKLIGQPILEAMQSLLATDENEVEE
jgi:hypothetical protein